MPRSGTRSIVQFLATLGASVALIALAALPALAEEPDPAANADAVRQAAVEQADAARTASLERADEVVSTMPGIGVDAPAVVIEVEPIVVQKNITIDASLNGTPDTVQQSASNDATVSQNSSAQAGTSSAPDGGIAISGGAVSGGVVVVTQINVEVVAGFVPDGGVTQDASNSATVDQTATAVGGDASASGQGSSAAGGNANALAITRVSQFNMLLFVGTESDSADSVAQAGSNSAAVSQNASAVAGNATADVDGSARSGGARDLSTIAIWQSNLVRNW